MAEITVGKKVFIIPDSGSPCDLWRAYFAKLKKEIGSENAKMIWLITWGKNGSVSCTTNAEFNRWLKKNEIDVSNAATRAVADISSLHSGIMGLGKNLTKILSVGVPILLGGVFLTVLFILIRTSKNMDLKDVAAMTPTGRIGKAAQVLKT